MPNTGFDLVVRRHLERLSRVLGGDWALSELTADGPRAIATVPGLSAALAGTTWLVEVAEAEQHGVVIRLDNAPASQSGGRTKRAGAQVSRCLVGVNLAAGTPREETAALVTLVGELIGELAVAADRAEADRLRAERLELRASTDPLTGLLNRRGWDRLLAVEEDRCRRHGMGAEVVIVDLDGLKAINDRLGHEAGDALLIRTTTYIFSAVRVHDAVARLGGDEFGVLAVGTEPGAERVGQRIEACLAEGEISASVGSAPRGDGTLIDACRVADLRMYRVKQRHRRARKPTTSHRAHGNG